MEAKKNDFYWEIAGTRLIRLIINDNNKETVILKGKLQ